MDQETSAAGLNKAEVLSNFAPAIGFKEWAIVCDSISRGETSLIFRKGGIAEGRGGFRFKHDCFFLFPTYFHEQLERTRLSDEFAVEPRQDTRDKVAISVFIQVEFTGWISNLDQLQGLEQLHILSPAVLEERFHYDDQNGLHLAFFRAWRLANRWEFPFQKSYGGCRSWVALPAVPSDLQLQPILEVSEQANRRSLVRSMV